MTCKEEVEELKEKLVRVAKAKDNYFLNREVQEISRELDEKILQYYATVAKASE